MKSEVSRLVLSNNNRKILVALFATNFANVFTEELIHKVREKEKLTELVQLSSEVS